MINKLELDKLKVAGYLKLDAFTDELNNNLEKLATAIESIDANGVITIPGKDGTNGVDGKDGKDGVDGKDGAPGAKGEQGIQGERGLPGKDGTNGLPGKDGKDGLPGIQGLKGDKGEQGIQGLPGKDGTNGKDGVSITSAVVNSTGNLIITKSDGTTIDAGKVSATAATTTTAPAVGGPPVVGSAPNPTATTTSSFATAMKGYIAGYIDAGQYITMDNLKFTVTTGGARGLAAATVSGNIVSIISGTIGYVGGGGGMSTNGTWTITPTLSGSFFGWSFPDAGGTCTCLINDTTNQRVYRVNMMIGPGYLKNFISIERLY